MERQVEDAALLFGGAKDAALTKGQAIDALSAMGIAVRWVHGTRCPGICYRDSDADALLGDEVNAQELLQIASKLKLKNITKDEFMKLVHDLNPSSRGTISRGTLQYMLKTSHHIPDEQLDEFFRDLNLREENGMISSDALVNSLMSILN
ncbi:hypothetical protein X943_003135 [Babesia divergens]|uniref:Uncharacterized protein n=1 Tax=Babesia divergens TaxID=32595 RepID=A0AAD9LFQ7_BABDI|nr:hypothetical protein X943_003135 [Babesia divergens]